jgi:biotin transport system substrate-specific component
LPTSLRTRDLAYAGLFAALTAVGALVSIPFVGPVPFTLQVLFVLLAGMLLGPRLGMLSMLAYLGLGLVAPVYAQGTGGLGALFGPAGGYLWGFVVAAGVTGAIARRRPTFMGFLVAGLAGLVPIYVLGATWLGWQVGGAAGHVIWIGVLQFVPGDLVKVAVAAAAATALVSSPLGLPAFAKDR